MIPDLINGTDFTDWLLGLLYSLPGILLALSFHELSHGFVALRLGDRTAKSMGRLSMNPLRHVDPIGFLFLLLLRYGWAKPVMIDYRNLKHPKRDIALVSLAGPVANFLLGWLCYLLYVLTFRAMGLVTQEWLFGLMNGVLGILIYAVLTNINFGLFNLIPVPPLDGSKILYSFLPSRIVLKLAPYERYSWILLIALLYFKVLSVPLGFLSSQILDFYSFTVEKVLFFL